MEIAEYPVLYLKIILEVQSELTEKEIADIRDALNIGLRKLKKRFPIDSYQIVVSIRNE